MKSKFKQLVQDLMKIFGYSPDEEDEMAKKVLLLFAKGILNWRKL